MRGYSASREIGCIHPIDGGGEGKVCFVINWQLICEKRSVRFHVRDAPGKLPVDFLLFRPIPAEDIRIKKLLSNTQGDEQGKHVIFASGAPDQQFDKPGNKET